MSESALDRVARALDLIPFITNNPGLSVVQIAERFNTTPTQISKDLSLLHMCGLPGYSHLELLDIEYEDPNFVAVTQAQVLDQPRSLTQVEAVTLVLGLQMLAELSTNDEERDSITALRERIADKYETHLSQNISISDAISETPQTNQILTEMNQNRWLHLEYNSATRDSVTSREIFPLHLYYANGIGYLRAFTNEAGEERTYRLDRITQLTLGRVDDEFLKLLVPEDQSDEPTVIEIEMGEDGYFFIERHREIIAAYKEIDGRFHIQLRLGAGEWITRTLLAWPSRIEVLKPQLLAETIKNRAAGTLENYQ